VSDAGGDPLRVARGMVSGSADTDDVSVTSEGQQERSAERPHARPEHTGHLLGTPGLEPDIMEGEDEPRG
jgi:hypothetical protein